ncbi:hypothetical protein D3C81_789540 [compost metagenome]
MPSGPATTVAVVPSGKLTVTIAPGSDVQPVIGSLPLTGSTSGSGGAMVSTIAVPGPDVLPAGSVAVAVTVS